MEISKLTIWNIPQRKIKSANVIKNPNENLVKNTLLYNSSDFVQIIPLRVNPKVLKMFFSKKLEQNFELLNMLNLNSKMNPDEAIIGRLSAAEKIDRYDEKRLTVNGNFDVFQKQDTRFKFQPKLSKIKIAKLRIRR